jgi:uncharacterized protein (UPF0332 family)
MSVFSDDLLEQARHLQKLDLKKPKQANLRRAVSSAYYSLFHLLIDEATQLVVATNHKSEPLRLLTARCFEHGTMKSACLGFTEATPRTILRPMWTKLGLDKPKSQRDANAAKLTDVAEAFARLQAERHRADYDLGNNFTRAEVEGLIERAEQARADWRDLRSRDAELAHFFAMGLLCWKMWQNR